MTLESLDDIQVGSSDQDAVYHSAQQQRTAESTVGMIKIIDLEVTVPHRLEGYDMIHLSQKFILTKQNGIRQLVEKEQRDDDGIGLAIPLKLKSLSTETATSSLRKYNAFCTDTLQISKKT